ncbi:MAG: sulfurtransferase complex subunit TusB [Thermoplasmata archaeon]|nr:sulfurtransferase complex subunit TusB [Thermoplasmata archaeon]NIS12451.1 sulfurtransferase complex subunit TusB [Thermoplasmata archaeon]NIS20372.1 sulfurtransferase complex subunit TusB [Thermoplasmata archaeon]NIT77718.1 sulfurtransferase complex subunit TusB [Thermoplasmata archaeon]NIU49459.1 sulfurtransferase complex subunit TusB [Thermoplasmata archaeon]
MNMLYMVKRSPFMSHDLDQVLIVANAGSHIVLYQDGVMAAAESPVTKEWLDKANLKGIKVHALLEDLSARGIKEPMDGIELIDYNGWVDLVESFQTVSW